MYQYRAKTFKQRNKACLKHFDLFAVVQGVTLEK